MRGIRKGEYLAPSLANPSLPAAVDEVLAKALAGHPEDRYSDARSFQVALDELAEAQGWRSAPGEVGEVMARLCPILNGPVIDSGQEGTQVSGQPIASGTVPAQSPVKGRSSLNRTQAAQPPLRDDDLEGSFHLETNPTAAHFASADTDPAVSTLSSSPALSEMVGHEPISVPLGTKRNVPQQLLIGAFLLCVAVFGAVALTSSKDEVPEDWTLEINAVPEGAEVFINNEKRGFSPLTVRNIEGDKTVRVRIEREGFKPMSRTIALTKGGGMLPLHHSLEPETPTGNVIINVTPPHAFVKVDGEHLGKDANVGPGRYSFVRNSGESKVSFIADGYTAIQKTLNVPKRSTLSLTVDLKPVPMWVEVRTRKSKKVKGNVTIVDAGKQRLNCDSLPCLRKVLEPGKVLVKAKTGRMAQPWVSSQVGKPGHKLVFVIPAIEQKTSRKFENEARFTAVVIPAKGESLGLVGARLLKSPQGTGRTSLPDGRTITLRYVFNQETGQITFTVASSPYSAVHLNSLPLGNTPQTRTVGPGVHTLYLSGLEAKVRMNYQFAR
jgi:hypothetical protein